MRSREEAIRRYFAAWVENDPSCLREVFAPEIVYSECYGPEYRGLGQIEKWFADWNKKGRVLEWTVKSFLHQGNRTAVGWFFCCEYEGRSCFDGVVRRVAGRHRLAIIRPVSRSSSTGVGVVDMRLSLPVVR